MNEKVAVASALSNDLARAMDEIQNQIRETQDTQETGTTQDTHERQPKRHKTGRRRRSTPTLLEAAATATCTLSPEKARAIAKVVSSLGRGATFDACVDVLEADTALGDRDCRLLEAVSDQLSKLANDPESESPRYVCGYTIALSSVDRDLILECAKDLRALQNVIPCSDVMDEFSERCMDGERLLDASFDSIRFSMIEPVLDMYTRKIKEAEAHDREDEDDDEEEIE